MLLGVLATFLILTPAAQAAVEGDWPCIQRKVGELAAARIERFAAEAGRDRDVKLTALFARVLERINAERGRLVAGIERYARKQRELAERIKAVGLAVAAPRVEA